ncbi:MAG: prephenate dehydrogenase [Flavobacteriia bacterium]|nr:prephenate dehydrogenase [Flavobacteriia bacterium]OIP47157.1 MAG: prephenate dehydrogenase [Flavobacteriaceae bacterium CG2_30_31_66]PIV97689.1 MAG: prephenate dehydrogenase [Flavobacteriaceae bacterium CG17_big_fil_post_rev_8_21_14_2_50_31_13]PIX13351.1 MAG: prephenate dehydrogenase [Flavobacteriaceae bacterium CG_4_8_14_3_um_filter_31_8]PIY13804.1 MAG: prephenate dehydrogenase [Flavobacteriaceae bacterium CG_4_10_14_3_um_filter_31_253]PIZ10720.1 MAG: prephenate dehydrogenase [Flavobacter
MKNIYLIGIGLIGGSFAIDIKKHFPESIIHGISRKEATLEEALSLNLIDKKATLDDLENADVVIISIPVDATVKMLPTILDKISDSSLVIDAGSTKEAICKVIENHPKRRNFLACHPIAGTENSGPSAAIPDLYVGKTNIICEVEKTTFKLQEKALQLFTAIGMRIRYMDPVAHDKHIAYVSHLSHISSFMLGKTVLEKERNERDIFDMAGSGFASTVRLAKSSPAMWTPIFEQNKDNIIETLEKYINNLQHFKELMEEKKFDEIYNEMENTNYIKQILNGIK